MTSQGCIKMSEHWDTAFFQYKNLCLKYKDYYLYRTKHLSHLLQLWLGSCKSLTILKVDLWNEAIGHDDALHFFCNKENTLLGLDISQVVTDTATINFTKNPESFQSFKFIQSDVQDLPFEDNSIDIVFSISTFDHMTPDEIIISLKEISRVLKQDGHIVFTVDNATYIFLRGYFYRFLKRSGVFSTKTPDYYCPYTLSEFKSFISKSELKLENWSGVSLLPNFTQKIYVTRNQRLMNMFETLEKHKILDFFKYEMVFHLRKWN